MSTVSLWLQVYPANIINDDNVFLIVGVLLHYCRVNGGLLIY